MCDSQHCCWARAAAGTAVPLHHRPAPSDERVQFNAAGQVALKLKTPCSDGTAHVAMSPLEFMQVLRAPKPRSRLRSRMTGLGRMRA